MSRQRLDIRLTQAGLAETRTQARARIMAGEVLVNGQLADKPGTLIAQDARIALRGERPRYVSRGGLKLEKAIEAFDLQVKDKLCLDIGASTGGFTDCLLQNGAKTVYAVDVGYGQLAWSLRQDPRVVPMERTNIRHMSRDALPQAADLATIDVSFISLKIVVPVVRGFLSPAGAMVALIKPQFEVGKGQVGKGGVVRDPALHESVIDSLKAFFQQQGLDPSPAIASPILGPKGNQEFLIQLDLP